MTKPEDVLIEESSSLLGSLVADAAEVAASADTSTIEEVALDAWNITQRIEEFEAEVEAEKKNLRKITEKKLPALMNEQGIPEFGFETPDGKWTRMKIETRVVGSLNQAPDIEEAVAYLESSGLEGGVKTSVSVDFTESEKEEAKNFSKGLSSITNRAPNIARTLNAATLRSFVTNKLKEDPTWDYEKVGMFASPIIKITSK